MTDIEKGIISGFDSISRGKKAGATTHERREREKEERAALRNDRAQAIAICRKIRDDESAADADRLCAIMLLKEYDK